MNSITPKKHIISKIQMQPGLQKITKSADKEKALREQLHIEIENRTKACANASYDCTLQRLDFHEYCMKHILQDTRSPYKQCSFLYPNGRKCNEPAPKHSTKKDIGISTYCFEHSRLSQLNKLRTTVGKFKPVETPETLLNDLTKHVKTDSYMASTSAQRITVNDDGYDVSEALTPCVDPIVDMDSIIPSENARSILDYASDSESEDEPPSLANTQRNYELDDSDAESVDSQGEDLLKHAGIYTTEEATVITKDKLKRLQTLYIEQFQRLQHVLKEKRRNYIHSLKREKETLSSIYNQVLDTPEERIMYSKLKALNHYHRKTGVHSILAKKLHEKRAKITEGMQQKAPFYNKCIYTEGGVKCLDRSLPSAKYCRKHILEDKRQVLFRACGIEKSNVICQEPVANVFENSTCVLHINLPPQRVYIHKKYESTDEEVDTPKKKMIKREIVIDGRKISIKKEMKEEPSSSTADIKHGVTTDEEMDVNPICDYQLPPDSGDVNITIEHN